MRYASCAIPRTHSFLPRGLCALILFGLAAILGCGDGDDRSSDGGSTAGAASATQSRDVVFGPAAVTIVDDSFSFCPFEGTTITFHATGPMTTLDAVYTSTLSADGESTSFASGLGELRATPTQEVCASVSAPNWDASDEVCQTLEVGTSQLNFAFELSRPAGCIFEIELNAAVITFDPGAFCTASCSHLLDCGRPDEGCVAACVEDLQNVAPDDVICHDATRDWLTCLHTAPCVNEPEFFCESINSGYSAEAALFSSGQCTRPLPPPRPLPDPLACDPRQSELVAGSVGDFAVVALTSDFPEKHYLIFDLGQLGEIDAVLAASPTDPLLSTARSVLPTLRGLDGSVRDQCPEAGIVAIRFEVDLDLARSVYANLDDQLARLQQNLDSLASLAADLKRQAVAFIFDQIFCPATLTAFSIFPEPFGTIAGVAAQATIGCFD